MKLEPGDSIRYRGLGAGTVVRHVEREFKGQSRIFAVIEFPHRSMNAQLPVGDPQTLNKLTDILSTPEAKILLEEIKQPLMKLSRTWDQREEIGIGLIKTGGPKEWIKLLSAYAYARGHNGLAVSSSDQEMVREALEMTASELACALGIEYTQMLTEVKDKYNEAFLAHRAFAEEQGLLKEEKEEDD